MPVCPLSYNLLLMATRHTARGVLPLRNKEGRSGGWGVGGKNRCWREITGWYLTPPVCGVEYQGKIQYENTHTTLKTNKTSLVTKGLMVQMISSGKIYS